MKNLLTALLFLLAKTEIASASTGERSDDFLVLVVPIVFLSILGLGYIIRKKLKERNMPVEQEEIEQDTEENSE